MTGQIGCDMANSEIIVNTRKIKKPELKANGVTGEKTCAHTIRAEDLMMLQPIPGQASLSLALKLKG